MLMGTDGTRVFPVDFQSGTFRVRTDSRVAPFQHFSELRYALSVSCQAAGVI